jgi:hypothetical protein
VTAGTLLNACVVTSLTPIRLFPPRRLLHAEAAEMGRSLELR